MRKNQRHRREQRRIEAAERNEYWAGLSLSEQLVHLGGRPGSCKKQITKIKERIKDAT